MPQGVGGKRATGHLTWSLLADHAVTRSPDEDAPPLPGVTGRYAHHHTPAHHADHAPQPLLLPLPPRPPPPLPPPSPLLLGTAIVGKDGCGSNDRRIRQGRRRRPWGEGGHERKAAKGGSDREGTKTRRGRGALLLLWLLSLSPRPLPLVPRCPPLPLHVLRCPPLPPAVPNPGLFCYFGYLATLPLLLPLLLLPLRLILLLLLLRLTATAHACLCCDGCRCCSSPLVLLVLPLRRWGKSRLPLAYQ